MQPQPIRFVLNGVPHQAAGVDPHVSLLQYLREQLHLTGTKEGCAEGDCGACTVVIGELQTDARSAPGVRLKPINACIRALPTLDGKAVFTVEGLTQADGSLHPVQQAMVDCHASQCGFCTPGFVMSLFALHQNTPQPTRAQAIEALAGNLCRCTGYRPILDAAEAMPGRTGMPAAAPGATSVTPECGAALAHALTPLQRTADFSYSAHGVTFHAPRSIASFSRLAAAHLDAWILAGGTDVGLWINKLHLHFESVIDVTRVSELRCIEQRDGALRIGAAVPLEDAFTALVKLWPQLRSFAERFAGLPVRNSGTLGGNVANGSPIGDAMPLLTALGANVVLMRLTDGQISHRELPLEKLYTGYRTNVMALDEVLAWIKVPLPQAGEMSRIYKVSKRFEDDISAVCLGLRLHIDNGLIATASIGAGGVAATPVRAVKTEAALKGQPWTISTVKLAMDVLRQEFQPISDMRASSHYRTQVLGNLLQRFWLESQGKALASLESFDSNDLQAQEVSL